MKAFFFSLVIALIFAANVMAQCGEQTLASSTQESVAPAMEMSIVSDTATSLIGEAFVDTLLLLPFLAAMRMALSRRDRLALLKIG